MHRYDSVRKLFLAALKGEQASNCKLGSKIFMVMSRLKEMRLRGPYKSAINPLFKVVGTLVKERTVFTITNKELVPIDASNPDGQSTFHCPFCGDEVRDECVAAHLKKDLLEK